MQDKGKAFQDVFCTSIQQLGTRQNENANGIIRRFFPKGTDFSKMRLEEIQAVEDWMNDYPRRILGGISANKAISLAAA